VKINIWVHFHVKGTDVRRKDVVTSLSYQDVCYSKDAGYIEYNSPPGKVKAGCPHTPDIKILILCLAQTNRSYSKGNPASYAVQTIKQ